jgi:hypothetical protein
MAKREWPLLNLPPWAVPGSMGRVGPKPFGVTETIEREGGISHQLLQRTSTKGSETDLGMT